MKTKNTFAKIIKIVLAVMVLSLAGCGEEGKLKKKIDAMEQAAASGDRAAFEKAAHDAVYYAGFWKYKNNVEPEKNGKIYQLVDRMIEIGFSAPESSEDDFYFSLTDDGSGVRIDGLKYSYDSDSENRGKGFVVIPSKIQGLPVVEVVNTLESYDRLLKNENYKKLNYTLFVPGTVKKCGGNGYFHAIKFAEGVETIYGFNDYSKDWNDLVKVELPSSLKKIGNNAFSGEKNLRSINIPSNLISIQTSAFEGCEGLTDITLPESLKVLGNKAFYSCTNLKNINLPESLEMIGCGAFDYSSIEEASVPAGVKFLGLGAFAKCKNLKSLSIPASIQYVFYCWNKNES